MWDEKNNQLTQKYVQWLAEIKEKAPQLLEERYSNPDYISIPDEWFDTDGPRIMVIGEERFGEWGNGKKDGIPTEAIETIQKEHYCYLRDQLGSDKEKWNLKSKFWIWFRRVAEHGVCAWSNIDKFHKLGKNNCALSDSERKLLHSVDIKILQEEISILDPTHIIFFGWHGTSLLHELPELYGRLYPDKAWKKGVIPVENYEGRPCVFSNHPNRKSKEYEDRVMETFKATL